MTELFIEKMLLAWIILDLILVCVLMLAMPSAECAISSLAGTAGEGAGESDYGEQLPQSTLEGYELTDGELLHRLPAAAVDSSRLVNESRVVIADSKELLSSVFKSNGPTVR